MREKINMKEKYTVFPFFLYSVFLASLLFSIFHFRISVRVFRRVYINPIVQSDAFSVLVWKPESFYEIIEEEDINANSSRAFNLAHLRIPKIFERSLPLPLNYRNENAFFLPAGLCFFYPLSTLYPYE